MATDNSKKTNAAPAKKSKITEYMKGVKTEIKKVVWPTRKELGSFTTVVIITCSFFALAFWAIDSSVLFALKNILGITL